jgi:hypothetical protein
LTSPKEGADAGRVNNGTADGREEFGIVWLEPVMGLRTLLGAAFSTG